MKIQFKLFLENLFECVRKFPYYWKIHISDKYPYVFSVESEYESNFHWEQWFCFITHFHGRWYCSKSLFVICYCHGKLGIGMTLKFIHDSYLCTYLGWPFTLYKMSTIVWVLLSLFIWNPCSWNIQFNNQYTTLRNGH